MSRAVARILISILLVPLGLVVYLTAVFLIQEVLRSRMNFTRIDERELILSCGAVTWLVVGGCWCLVWRKVVRWTTRRISGTALAVPVAALFGFVLMLVLSGNDLGEIIASIAAPLAWMMATVWIWRETSAEREERTRDSSKESIVCPKCGYNLTGLTTATCPECGSQYTLDQLLAAQPSRQRFEVA